MKQLPGLLTLQAYASVEQASHHSVTFNGLDNMSDALISLSLLCVDF